LEKPILRKHNNMPVLSHATSARTARNAIPWHASAHEKIVEPIPPQRELGTPRELSIDAGKPDEEAEPHTIRRRASRWAIGWATQLKPAGAEKL
jgi:hypothetical protein